MAAVVAGRSPRGAGGTRRRWLLAAGFVAVLGAFSLGAAAFAWPGAAARGEYAIGPVDSFAPGTVTTYLLKDGELRVLAPGEDYGPKPSSYPIEGNDIVHVVRLPDGELAVFSGASAFRDQTVVWFPLANPYDQGYVGLFAEPRRGTLWTIDGTRVFGPAPRGLDRPAFNVRADGVLVVDLANVSDGRRADELPPPYDVTSDGWSTSGWPSR